MMMMMMMIVYNFVGTKKTSYIESLSHMLSPNSCFDFKLSNKSIYNLFLFPPNVLLWRYIKLMTNKTRELSILIEENKSNLMENIGMKMQINT